MADDKTPITGPPTTAAPTESTAAAPAASAASAASTQRVREILRYSAGRGVTRYTVRVRDLDPGESMPKATGDAPPPDDETPAIFDVEKVDADVETHAERDLR